MEKYIIRDEQGKWHVYNSTAMKRAFNKGLRPDEQGGVTLKGGWYLTDPKKMERLPYRPRRYLWLVEEEARTQMWREGNPEPIDFNEFESQVEIDDDRTAKKIGIVMRTKKLHLTQQRFDPLVMLLLLSIFANLAMGAAIFYMQQGGP